MEIGKILRKLCEWKGVEIHEAEICPDHVHMLISIPPKVSVSSFMGYLKGESSVLQYGQFGELQYKYRNQEFWCRGYYVDTVGKNTKAIAEYSCSWKYCRFTRPAMVMYPFSRCSAISCMISL